MNYSYTILVVIWAVIIGIYFLFKFLNKPDLELDAEIKKILSSKEHKAK